MNRRQFLAKTSAAGAAVVAAALLVRRTSNAAQTGPPSDKASAPMRLAVVGFQHNHIWSLLSAVKARADIQIVAACEEDPVMRAALAKSGKIKITHSDYRQLLDQGGFDAVAVGDWFGKRGRLVKGALEHGRPAVSDKPLCTTLADYGRILDLSRAKSLAVGMMLDLRDSGVFRKMREVVRSGDIGEIHEMSVGAEHPLSLASRPHWYHEAGKHGGTINDIGVHGFDLIPWVTGLDFKSVVAARAWKTNEIPPDSAFVNAGQVMLEMDNGAGVTGSFSYVSPSSMGYSLPMYWRLTLWGSRGAIEGSANSKQIMLYKEGEKQGRSIELSSPGKGSFLDSFVKTVRGEPGATLSTTAVLRATRVALVAQEAADKQITRASLTS